MYGEEKEIGSKTKREIQRHPKVKKRETRRHPEVKKREMQKHLKVKKRRKNERGNKGRMEYRNT